MGSESPHCGVKCYVIQWNGASIETSSIFSFEVTFYNQLSGNHKKAAKSNRISSGTDISNYVKNSFHNTSKGKKKRLNTVSLAARAAVIVLQINGCGEHVCAVGDNLCDAIRCKLLFSLLFNGLLAKVICGYQIFPCGTVLSSVEASGLFANT